MNFSPLVLSVILLSLAPVQCQRRNTGRGMRQGTRRPPYKEERLRGTRTPQVGLNYSTVPNKVMPAAMPCQRTVEPPCAKTFEPVPQVLQNMPQIPEVAKPINMPIVPNAEFAQNVVISPNLQLMQTPQIVSNPQPIVNMPVPNMPAIHSLPNLQYAQNVQLVPNLPLIPENPIPNVPLLEVPRPVPEKIRAHIPYPSVEPLDRYCSCLSSPLVSPYLPAASPVSAFSPPTSNFLPPLTASQSRSHFLRKIPIPPPTL